MVREAHGYAATLSCHDVCRARIGTRKSLLGLGRLGLGLGLSSGDVGGQRSRSAGFAALDTAFSFHLCSFGLGHLLLVPGGPLDGLSRGRKNDVGLGLPSRLVERHCPQHHPVFGIRARELSLLGAFGLCDWRASSGLGGSLHRLWAKVSCRLYHLLYASDLRVLLVCLYW